MMCVLTKAVELRTTAKSEEADTIGTVGNLTELIVDGFDSEQVWQELELQNQPLLEHLSGITGALLDDEEDIDLEADFNVDFEEGEEDEEQEDDFDEEEGMPGLEEYEDGSDADHSEGSDDYNSEEREMQEKVRRMREKAREEEGEDDESITSDEDEQERQRTKRNKVKSVLDDEFFDLEEMNRFADVGESYGGVGETYGGLITNLGDNDDEEMYELMYGSGSSSKKRKDKDDAHDLKPKKSRKNEGGLFGNAEELDSEDEQLQAALQQARKEFGAESGDEEDGEAGFGDGDDDGSDLDGEEAYYEDFFEDPDPSRARRSRASEAESRDAKRMDDEDAAYYHDDDDGEALDGEDDDLQDDGADQDGDEQDDDQELSSYQKEMRRKERELRALEQGMMTEDARDEKTMLSTGDLGVSGFEMSQRRMQQRIEGLENELVGKKKWATLGEAKSGQRGLNTLLEEDLEFDIALKAAPLVTAEFTKRIEDMIKKRIVDQVFDDPVKKLGKPEQGDYRPRTAELDQEKSEKSLAQIYEDDYVRQIEGVKDQDKLSQEHKDCVGLFKSICYRMDALSNANFTPYKVREEVEVVAHKDAAAIQMEEVMPMTVSDAAVLAPEEVYRPAKTAVRGDSEYTTDEKKAMRRDRKRKHAKEEVEKKAEERRQAILHPEKAFKRKPSIAQALKLISKDSHTTISANTDKTKYSSTGAFKKIASASTTDQ